MSDTGVLLSASGARRRSSTSCAWAPGCRVATGCHTRPRRCASATWSRPMVDHDRRAAIRRNHTAHAPAARGAAPDAGRARQAGRIARGAGSAALRLRARRAGHARRSPAHRADRQRRDPGQRAGAHRGEGHAAGDRRRRHGALRREVRRSRARRGGRRRPVQHRIVRRHARARPPATSACSCSPRSRAWRRECAASRPSPAPGRSLTCARRSTTCSAPRRRRTLPPRSSRQDRAAGGVTGQGAEGDSRVEDHGGDGRHTLGRRRRRHHGGRRSPS